MKPLTCFFITFLLVIAGGWAWLAHENRTLQTLNAAEQQPTSAGHRRLAPGTDSDRARAGESRTGARAIDLLGKMLAETIRPETISHIDGKRETMFRLMTTPGVATGQWEAIRLAFDRFLEESYVIKCDGTLTGEEREQRLTALDARRLEWVKAHLGEEIFDAWNERNEMAAMAAAAESAKDAAKRLDDAVGLSEGQYLELVGSLEEKARLPDGQYEQMQVIPRASLETAGIRVDLSDDIAEILGDDQKVGFQLATEARMASDEAMNQAMEELMQALVPALFQLNERQTGE